MTSPSHRRARPARRPVRVPLLTVVAVAAVALVVSLVIALRPDGGPGGPSEAGKDRAASVAGARTDTQPTPTAESASPSPSTASPSPKASTKAPTKSAKPSSAPASARAAAKPAPRKPVTAAAPSSGRIRPGATYQGVATAYDSNGDGACSYGPTSDVMNAAMNTTDYETSRACGAYVLVRASSGKSITVRITNECPAPCQPGQLDLSQQAFAKLAPLSTGRIAITWSLLSPETSDTISIRYKTGSSQYWCGIQAIGHRNPLASLEVRTGGGWKALPRTGYNYFLSEQGTGCGSAIRLTDIYGEQLTVGALPVRANVVQPTGIQFARH
ncbi:expansin EXLX1 family cellulose-binding protein [Streptomyces sp. NPDC048751]|uniref:expansin EXLX1 family cellulose-binding protein n=1 Tax=Streptomyces sp. NPDC048751 TaxID=3365591 RepID=UPI00371920FD